MDRQVIVRVSRVRVAAVARVAREVMEVVDTADILATPRLVKNQVTAMEDTAASFLAKQVEEDMVENTEVDPDHPRVVSQEDVDVKVHLTLRPEDMVLAVVGSRVRDARVARDRVTSDGGDQVMGMDQPRAIPRQARYLARVTVMDMEDTARIFVRTYGTCVK